MDVNLWEDIKAASSLAAVALGVLVLTFLGLLLGEWFASLVYRAGDHGVAAEWLAHLAALAVTLIVVLSLVDRLFSDQWWFKK